MNKKIIIIGLCIVLIVLVSGSYRPLVYRIFNDYEEECYQYKIYYWNETYCNISMWGSEYKNTNINEEYPCCNNETSEFTWGNGTKYESRWCYGFPFNKTFQKFTDECDVYHLVRKNIGD